MVPRLARAQRPHFTAMCEVAQMLADGVGLPSSIAGLVAHLTERWDGKGPLRRAKGEEIPLPLRIVHVAVDVPQSRNLDARGRRPCSVARERAAAGRAPVSVAARGRGHFCRVLARSTLHLRRSEVAFAAMRGRRILGVAMVAAAIAVAGCGDDDKPAAAGTDLTALKCPLEATGKQIGGVDEYRPAANAFDTKELIGEPIDAARGIAADHGCEIAVAMEDGKGLPVATDIDPKRIYVYTEDGVVTQVEGVGGGI